MNNGEDAGIGQEGTGDAADVAGVGGVVSATTQQQRQQRTPTALLPTSPPLKRRKHSPDDDDDNADGGSDPGDGLDDRKPAAKPNSPHSSNDGESNNDDNATPRKSPSKRKRNNNNNNPGNNNNNDDITNHNELSIAPTLDEYLSNSGHTKYRPRPEWTQASNQTSAVKAAVNIAMRLLPNITTNPNASALAARVGVDGGEHHHRHHLAHHNNRAALALPPPPPIPRHGVAAAAAVNNPNQFAIHADADNEPQPQPPAPNNNNNEQEEMQIIPQIAIDAARAAMEHNNPHQHQQQQHVARQVGFALGQHLQSLGQQRRQLQALGVQENAAADNDNNGGAGDNGGGGRVVRIDHRESQQFLMEHPHHHHRYHNHHHHPHVRADPDRGNNAAVGAAAANDDGNNPEFPPPLGNAEIAAAIVANVAHPAVMFNVDNRHVANENDDSVREGAAAVAGGDREEDAPSRARRHAPSVLGSLPSAPGETIDHLLNPRQSTTGAEEIPDNSNPSGGAAKAVAVFGFECDSALHLAIKHRATEAALALIESGASINFKNAKGITPLMIASQEGNLRVVQALLQKGALTNATTIRGSTALIQACHFGKLDVVEELLKRGALVDQANLKNTTALMRAAQEGHEDVVQLLLSRNTGVNRRNDERMTALMLSSQRGHGSIVQMLIKAGAQVDACTSQDSTSLMLACKRKHLHVAKILVASGTELKLKDCKDRTVLETATRRGNEDFARILTDAAQVRLMRIESRKERNFTMVTMWKLLQSERATIRVGGIDTTIHKVAANIRDAPVLENLCPSKRTLVRAMTLPAPLIELIASFIPPPLIWEKRLMLLTSRSHIDPDSAVYNALDLIDEVLEVGGVLEAFDSADVSPPSNFKSWSAYQTWKGKCGVILSRLNIVDHIDLANSADIYSQEDSDAVFGVRTRPPSPNDFRLVEPPATLRRGCNYLSVLAHAPPILSATLSSEPFEMPVALVGKLKACHDIQSLVRRLTGGGVHFDTSVANEMVVLARMSVMWCEIRPMY